MFITHCGNIIKAGNYIDSVVEICQLFYYSRRGYISIAPQRRKGYTKKKINIFSNKLASILLQNSKYNYAINLEEGKTLL